MPGVDIQSLSWILRRCNKAFYNDFIMIIIILTETIYTETIVKIVTQECVNNTRKLFSGF